MAATWGTFEGYDLGPVVGQGIWGGAPNGVMDWEGFSALGQPYPEIVDFASTGDAALVGRGKVLKVVPAGTTSGYYAGAWLPLGDLVAAGDGIVRLSFDQYRLPMAQELYVKENNTTMPSGWELRQYGLNERVYAFNDLVRAPSEPLVTGVWQKVEVELDFTEPVGPGSNGYERGTARMWVDGVGGTAAVFATPARVFRGLAFSVYATSLIPNEGPNYFDNLALEPLDLPPPPNPPRSGPHYYDERDGRVYSLTLPERPEPPTASAAAVPDTAILPLTGTKGARVKSASGWYVYHALNPDPVDGDTTESGGFRLADWQPGPGMGADAVLHIDTNTTTADDHLYYDLGAGNELDLSAATKISLTVVSGGNEQLTGTFLNLTLGETAAGEIVLPLDVRTANTKQRVTVDLSAYPVASRDSIRYVGFSAAQATEFVVWMSDLRTGSGLTGEHRYKIRDVRVEGWQSPVDTENPLPSPEAPGPDDEDLTVDAGAAGAQITLSRASVPDDAAWWEVWRLDDGIAGRYHWVSRWPVHDRWQPETAMAADDIRRPSTLGQARSGANQSFFRVLSVSGEGKTGGRDDEPDWDSLSTPGDTLSDGEVTWEWRSAGDVTDVLTYVDSTFDVSDAPVLEEGRVHVPVPATSLGWHDGRLVLAVSNPTEAAKRMHVGNLWLSGRGNHADWHDWGPEGWPELEAAGRLTGASACRLPMSEAGRVARMLPLGAWTGAAFTGPLLVATMGGWLVALQGGVPSLTDPDGLSLGHRVRGGCCAPYAMCRDAGGLLYVVTPDGDVLAVDRELRTRVLSGPLEPVLRAVPDRDRVRAVLGYDPHHARLVLWAPVNTVFAGRLFAFDADGTDGASGWDELRVEDYGRPTCADTRFGPDGRLLTGHAAGVVRRVLDPDAEALSWSYTSAAIVAPGRMLRPVRLMGQHEGLPSYSLLVDGAPVSEPERPASLAIWKTPNRMGRAVSLRITGEPGDEALGVTLSTVVRRAM